MKPGFYENLPRAEYDQIDAHNYSRLKYLERSPMAYRYNFDHPTPPTAPMILGNAAHLAILEPSMANFAVWSGPGPRNGHKWDAFRRENEGKTLLNVKERDYVAGMMKAVHANEDAYKYLRHVRTEVSMVWNDPMFGRDFKARLDAVTDVEDETFLVSLKSTADCRAFRFESQYHKMAYYVQDAIYQLGYSYLTHTLPQMVTIAVESKPPHESAVYRIKKHVLDRGEADLRKWMQRLNQCERDNKWPRAAEGEQDLDLPSYAYPGGDFEMDDLEPIER